MYTYMYIYTAHRTLCLEVTALAGKLPGDSDVLGKTEDETQ